MSTHQTTRHIEVVGPPRDRHGEILTPEALDFVARLDTAFARRRRDLLAARRHRADSLASGHPLDFPRATSAVRDDPHWRVAPQAPGPGDRHRASVPGPPQAGTAAHSHGSGADPRVVDFTEVPSPLWENVLAGQLALTDACPHPAGSGAPHGPEPRAGGGVPALAVRPRGWHLEEENLRIDGRPVSASLVDFGLYVFHRARHLTGAGSGPRLHLAGLENRFEARLWNDVFLLAQDLLGMPRGTVRATAVIDTVTAAFEMEEILYELREHGSGLAADRWHYLVSVIGTFGHRTPFLLPDSTEDAVTAPFIRAYSELLVRTCRRRNAPATGDLPPTARGPEDTPVRAADLLAAGRTGPAQTPTRQQLRSAVALALRHTETWLRDRGTTAPGRLAGGQAAELTRARLWQWRRQRLVSPTDLRALIDVESAAMAREHPGAAVAAAREVLEGTLLEDALPPLLTPDTYRRGLICAAGGSA
ncbi:malate synthase A [Streptomyces sp. NPDC014891]|uniref:malate synthase A n=1 Tax=Streptomyces sp. NPDC014891 TaxID=3364929 RepID=UPI0036FB7921